MNLFYIALFFLSLVNLSAKCLSGDCQNGIGIDLDPSQNTRYEGQFQYGKKNGKGKLTDSAGNVFSGLWQNEEPIKGIYRFKNGDRYSGKLKNRMFHGLGVFTFANGDKYTGEFKNDKKSGTGTMVYTSLRRIYIGKWKNDKQHGKGSVFYFTDSEAGKYSNGVKVP